MMSKNNLFSVIYVAENPIDVRMVRGLTRYFYLEILGRRNVRDNYINWPFTDNDNYSISFLAHNRLLFALDVFIYLIKHRKSYHAVLVVDNLLGALAANIAKIVTKKPVLIQVGRTPEEYYRCKYLRKEINLVMYFLGFVFLKFMVMMNSLLSDCNLVVTKYNYNRIERYSKYSEIVPWYGVDLSIYKCCSSKEKKRLRKALNLPMESFIVFYPSRISAEKDPETLIRAVRKIQEGNVDIILLNLSGQYKKFEFLARENGVKAIARPPVNPLVDLAKFYNASDLFVQTSLAEGIGTSHLEGLACGLPVIVSNVGGLTDLMRDGIYGKIVPPQDIEALRKAILFAVENYCLMKKWALGARKKIERMYSDEFAFKKIEGIIKRLSRVNENIAVDE